MTSSRQVEYLPLSELAENPKNPKNHELQTVGESISRFGMIDPIVRDERTGFLIAGHGRKNSLEALKNNGETPPEGVQVTESGEWLVPVLTGWGSRSDSEANAALIALNRTTEVGGWDDEALAGLLDELAEVEDGLQGVGYDDEDLELLSRDLRRIEEVNLEEQDDDIPDVLVNRTHFGEIWELGDHRLLCGDATNESMISLLMDRKSADVMWIDPPYGVDYVGKTPEALTIANDLSEGLSEFLSGIFTSAFQVLRPGGAIYVAHADSERITFETELKNAGFTIRQNLIWSKNTIVLGRSDYHYKHEPILYGFKPAPEGYGRLGRGGNHWFGDDSQSTVFNIDKPARNSEHPTMKPVELIEAMLANNAGRGDKVTDLCAGSGSTLIAAENLGMHAYVAEIDPKYTDVIIARWENKTGRQAELIHKEK